MMNVFFTMMKGDTWRKAICLSCILCCCSIAFAQTKVSGKIVDVDGISIVGANVSEKGAINGIDIQSDEGWEQIIKGIDVLIDIMIK
jgi:hypothetical protein